MIKIWRRLSRFILERIVVVKYKYTPLPEDYFEWNAGDTLLDGMGKWHTFTDCPIVLKDRNVQLIKPKDFLRDTTHSICFVCKKKLAHAYDKKGLVAHARVWK